MEGEFMGSAIGWVDFEERDRDKMLNVIRLFQEQDTRDELGIGVIRDALSDTLFPGTSTIQTRAKYMLFIPWMYKELEQKEVPSAKIGEKARQYEIRLIKPLLASEDNAGVIGQDAGSSLQRLPSNIYWAGLGRWGIRLYAGSQQDYHTYLDYFYRKRRARVVGDDGEYIEGPLRENWDPGLPDPPKEFPYSATMNLNFEEADYLKERILKNCKDTALAFLIANTDPIKCNAIWEHPDASNFPESIKRAVAHAENFSLVIHGAFLLYNYLLAKKVPNPELMEKYREAFRDWSGNIKNNSDKLYHWDVSDFWVLVKSQPGKIYPLTQKFVERWIQLSVNSEEPFSLLENDSAESLIRNRELRIKKSKRARLTNPRALELWSGASGTRRLDFRWGIVNQIVNDILEGLKREGRE